MLGIFIPKESASNETRVALTPDAVTKLTKDGFQVAIEKNAGIGAHFDDEAYRKAGATLTDATTGYAGADIVLQFHPPEAAQLKTGALVVAFLWPSAHKDLLSKLAARKIDAFAMDQVPRISRAQKMDALSSQSNLAGYKAAMLAAEHLPKLFPLMMTAAGTIRPARVVILGAGVAGLQAIATCRRLGAVVEVSDVRTAVKEQVESLGARFIEVPAQENLDGSGGYAREASEAYLKKQRDEVRRHILAADAVITTALVPGKPAPKLIDAETVAAMRPGSVIVDLAAPQGGNCAVSQSGKIIRHGGVTVIGLDNLPGLVPVNASEVYANNLLAVMKHLYPKGAAGGLQLDRNDEITAASLVTHAGEVLYK